MKKYDLNNDFFNEIISLPTEQINPRTTEIDVLDTKSILKLINDEDKTVPIAIEKEIDYITEAVELIVSAFQNGGRLIYLGAGTSGRLGVVDASECPPTYGTNPDMVIGLIAGGKEAMFVAQEGAEDNLELPIEDLKRINLTVQDIVCGIAASGRTPYVKSGINFSHQIGCKTIMLTTSKREEAQKKGINADIFICPYVGPEVIAGSTRMKSGTAQKLVLNMLTTTSMIQLGKTYGNIMVDLQQTNAKLAERSKNIIMNICNVNYEKASELLEESGKSVKIAIIMGKLNLSRENSEILLENFGGKLKLALNSSNQNSSIQKI